MTERCPDCVGGLDHCHGTVLVHADGAVECTDAECVDADRVRHAMVVDCAGTLPGCCLERVVLLAS